MIGKFHFMGMNMMKHITLANFYLTNQSQNGCSFGDKAQLVKAIYEKFDGLTAANKKVIIELVAKGDWLKSDDKEFKNKQKTLFTPENQKYPNLGLFDQIFTFS